MLRHLNRSSRPDKNTSHGFMLVDALITMTILSIGFTALIGLHAQSIEAQMTIQARSEAQRIAEGRLESLRYATSRLMKNTKSEGTESIDGSNSKFELYWSTTKNSELAYHAFNVTTFWNQGNYVGTVTTGAATAITQPMPGHLLMP